MKKKILLHLGLLLLMVVLVTAGAIIEDHVSMQPREHNSLKALLIWGAVGGVIGYVLVIFNIALKTLFSDVQFFIENWFREMMGIIRSRLRK